ncbi:DUF1045 domain-containing protein [Nitratireductor rhodophyticola]|uniref:DUF1045 domain-containing protein n=1 Tax=Nitratireductor rhodophyticola TaxID=2854036 RepID=A0ABS7R9S5_9HYPH|nr:DUF1045 domain-containing protein [Nitratireductor rhodophyticola]MBY8917140.1 DUF1045 domain-containing protein [Nitratireductor rhodophyticola]MBY8920431.1 DUF1045 domain-containing protein [Nitratireductor rhodophyticola]MEC9243673.1 DUF1045 domain-containing protein [Pseudomonadota bacterium]WPZ14883.1 DUF1045 domain-containing protein [Nitratireductor rhodophyticola]
MRYAIYFTPEQDDPLTRAAARWLGRDAFTGMPLTPVEAGPFSAAEISFHTAAARRYGFHATLKAPFRLAEGQSEQGLIQALTKFCAQMEPVTIPRAVVRRLDGFFALVPEERSERLDALAGSIVESFEPFRAPLTANELERRNPENLSPGQLKNLHKWGYPYVFEEFRFHMTLTGRVPQAEAPRMERAIDAFFGPLLSEPLEIGSLALFIESEPGAPFQVKSFQTLGWSKTRKTA